jgi:hypothetical protein
MPGGGGAEFEPEPTDTAERCCANAIRTLNTTKKQAIQAPNIANAVSVVGLMGAPSALQFADTRQAMLDARIGAYPRYQGGKVLADYVLCGP